jgi:hypothetical protein
MKIAKIIATSFSSRTVRESTELCGDPPVYTLHSQNFITKEDTRDLILLNIEMEKKCNPGVDVDLIIVNNNTGCQWGNDFIDSLNRTKLPFGKVITIQNTNEGWSYGAYNRGFLDYKNQYDFFIFTEDDVIIARDNYAKIALDTFLSIPKCGFVSYEGISISGLDLPKEDALHAHGAVGLTSTKILNKIVKKSGHLPYSEGCSRGDYREIIIEGEIAFTNAIYKLGFELVEIPDRQKLFDFAYDLMRGIDKPWYPSKIDALTYTAIKISKSFLYKILCMISLDKFYKKIKTHILKKSIN